MPLRIRLSRAGARKRPHYRIVVADSRSPRDGRFIEKLGTYSPLLAREHPERLKVDGERAKYWIGQGAQASERVLVLLGNAQVIEPPAHRERPQKSKPKTKAQERMKEAADRAEAEAKARAEAQAAPAEPEAPAEEAPAAEAAAEGGEEATQGGAA